MPRSGQAADLSEDSLDFDDYEFQRLVTERRRTDSDRSNFGILADENDYFRGLALQYDTSTGFPSASQAPCSQGSWETISATSHGTFQRPVYNQYSQPTWEPLPAGTDTPHITLNGVPAGPVCEMNALDKSPNVDSPFSGSWGPGCSADSQTLAESSNPINSTPDTLSPDPEGAFSDPQRFEDMDFADKIDLGEAQDGSLLYAGLSSAQTFPSVTRSETQNLYRDLGHLDIAGTYGGISQPSTEPSRSLALDPRSAPYASLHYLQTERNQISVPEPQTAKRKRQTSSKRHNVDKINSVRKSGACIRCAVLHEEVSYINFL